jgi:hypothetical protein
MKQQVLVQAVSQIQGNTFVGLDTHTDVALTGGRKNPQQGRVTKRVTGSVVQLFTNQNRNAYLDMVRRRLELEGKDPLSFELSERKWGTRVPNMPIVEHNGAYYLEVIFHRAGEVEYLLDGIVVPAGAIQGMPPRREADQGGLERRVVLRDYRADSIVEMRAQGQVFR